MKKKLWIALAAALVFCAGCHGRAPLEETETGQEEIQTRQEEMAQEESAEDSQDDSQEAAPPGEADLTVWLGNDLKSLDPAQALLICVCPLGMILRSSLLIMATST